MMRLYSKCEMQKDVAIADYTNTSLHGWHGFTYFILLDLMVVSIINFYV